MNKKRLQQKRHLVNLIRDFFTKQGFFEMETPLLVPSPGMEVHLQGFKADYINTQGKIENFYLPTSPEFALKKALGSGFSKVFEIARVFRNHGELGPLHHPEFNMLEWYRPGSYLEVMADVETFLDYLVRHFNAIPISGAEYWTKSIKRTTIKDCFKSYAGINLESGLKDLRLWRETAEKALSERVPPDESFEDVFFRIWLKLIEPRLGENRPEIVFDYPASMAALAKLKAPENLWAERFELYIKGVEIGNAFSELTDSNEQLRRFEAANQAREAHGFPPHPIDYEFIEAVGRMSPTGGIAVGVERLLMVLTGETDIRQCFLYPVAEANRK